jgi:hypothetical protein
MKRIVLIFDPAEAEANELSIEQIAEALNLYCAHMSAAYQGWRVEDEPPASLVAAEVERRRATF